MGEPTDSLVSLLPQRPPAAPFRLGGVAGLFRFFRDSLKHGFRGLFDHLFHFHCSFDLYGFHSFSNGLCHLFGFGFVCLLRLRLRRLFSDRFRSLNGFGLFAYRFCFGLCHSVAFTCSGLLSRFSFNFGQGFLQPLRRQIQSVIFLSRFNRFRVFLLAARSPTALGFFGFLFLSGLFRFGLGRGFITHLSRGFFLNP